MVLYGGGIFQIMKKSELQTRRDFFKKATLRILPLFGVVAAFISPYKLKAASQYGCGWSCLYSCMGQCINTCYMSCVSQCAIMCGNSCRGGCNDMCAINCQGGCNTQCHSTCLNTCNNTCFSMVAIENLDN